MALQGELRIDSYDSTFEVVECAYDFHQSIDETGKPTSRTKGGTITFVMPSTSDAELLFYKWMFNKTEVKSGRFRFVVYSNDNKQNYKTVRFRNAYCVDLKDYFNNNDSKLMYTTVTISAEVITIGDGNVAKFTNEWGNSALY